MTCGQRIAVEASRINSARLTSSELASDQIPLEDQRRQHTVINGHLVARSRS